ncbi:hypothetical protein NCCP2222_16140 [Sporosarcina sp. NCCP-2222]|nr:hypothetical protein NCCP2222_16140 [Sporosarcina sp. NCCP-2222]
MKTKLQNAIFKEQKKKQIFEELHQLLGNEKKYRPGGHKNSYRTHN